MSPLLKLFEDSDLCKAIGKLPGYDTEPFGKIIADVG
jgi:hypothetical protein